MLLFSILMSGGHLGGHLDVYSTLKLRVNSVKNRKNAKFQSKIEVQVSTLVSTRHHNSKKQHVSFHWKKKLTSYLFLLVFQLYKCRQLENCQIFSDLRATMKARIRQIGKDSAYLLASSCLSEKQKRLIQPILRGKTPFFVQKKKNAQNQRAKFIFSK